MSAARCPTPSQLAAFAVGDLPGPELARLAGHVEACPACEAALQSLDAVADPLLVGLRQPLPETEDVPPDLLAAARSARPPAAVSCWASGERPCRLGKFELLEELGAGSFGRVFRARDADLDRVVAIKFLRAGRLAGQEDVDRFLREARSAARLKHPGIVSLYETGQAEDGTYYLVEEFVPGQTLAQRLAEGPIGPRAAAELVAQVADALDYAHRHGVIHRDLKPSNIMLDQDGRPHLMDFGLAKRDGDDTPLTLDGEVLGTPAYMSPEQARGEAHKVDGRGDVYSLGVILYELLTGERPFQGNRRMLLLQVLEDEPRPPRRLCPEVPRDLETVCLKAMAKEPPRRYATGRDLADDLRRWLAGEPIKARPVGRAERLWRWCRRNPVPAGLLLAVTLGPAIGLWHLSSLSDQLVKESALESAAQEALTLEEAHDLYSGVVKRVETAGVPVVQETSQEAEPPRGTAAMLVPATFTHHLGQRVNHRSAPGMEVRLYSEYPFPWRQDGGPRDDFERQALRAMSAGGATERYEFTERDGRPVLRYVKAWVLKENCIHCHNTHRDSPKRDWKVGDVRGALQIVHPLDRDAERVRKGLTGTFVLVGVVSGGLLGLSVLVLVVSNRRRRTRA
ncbi:MAG TPA: protein kinase [Gemmataceae bacterium]|nr:protein kinase [Gemmataceae bacterium]